MNTKLTMADLLAIAEARAYKQDGTRNIWLFGASIAVVIAVLVTSAVFHDQRFGIILILLLPAFYFNVRKHLSTSKKILSALEVSFKDLTEEETPE